jgi:hypothetical protein
VTARLPSRLSLPSGAVITLRAGREARRGRAREPGAPLFSETLAAFDEGDVVLSDKGGSRLDPRDLALGDFHVLRAVVTKAGLVREDDVVITCRNCGASITARPSEALETGPFEHGELDDPELDATLATGEPHPIPPVSLGRVRTATSITFAKRTAREAAPLFAAAGAGPLDLDASLVRAMGIEALGAERDPSRIVRALASCDDAAFAAVSSAFLHTHYPPRLGAVIRCKGCGARNDVDAPYERELEPGEPSLARDGGEAPAPSPGAALPPFDDFADRARAIAEPMLARVPGEPVELVIEGGTPDVDDGGEPLLGSYLPPSHPGEVGVPTRAPCVTIYYRTFRAMWEEEGPYDWEEELHETLEHELEHHVSFLRGDDPTDDEEREVIREETLRVVGRREAGRRAALGFGASVSDFLRRTWPLWAIAALALAIALAGQR